jgi:hypothetical protein
MMNDYHTMSICCSKNVHCQSHAFWAQSSTKTNMLSITTNRYFSVEFAYTLEFNAPPVNCAPVKTNQTIKREHALNRNINQLNESRLKLKQLVLPDRYNIMFSGIKRLVLTLANK